MSAKSRSRHFLQLPIARDDFIVALEKMDEFDCVLAITDKGRMFRVTRVARYKRPYKVHEIYRSSFHA
jgi:hypothetical protein